MRGFPRRAAAHKYHAVEADCGFGHKHPSKREARRCAELHLLQRAGEIADLRVEPFFPFTVNGAVLKHGNGRRVGYRPDFVYERGDRRIAEDVKSPATRTEAYVLRSVLFRALYPEIELVEVAR